MYRVRREPGPVPLPIRERAARSWIGRAREGSPQMKRTRRAQHEQPAPPEQAAPPAETAGDEDSAPVPPDLSGWTPHPAERRDFLNRIRAFPPDVAAWRRRTLERVAAEP